jgi:hypothetical protein
MTRIKRIIQIKSYARANGLWMEGIFDSLFALSKGVVADYSKTVDFGREMDGHVFFLHEGTVLGSKPGANGYSRIVLGGEVFGNLQELTGWEIPRYSWVNGGKVLITAISLQHLARHYALAGANIRLLLDHLTALEIRRAALHEMLLKLPLAGKLIYLEEHAPRWLLEVKGIYLASLLRVSPQSLSREIARLHTPPTTPH